jgi:O-methyltransferase
MTDARNLILRVSRMIKQAAGIAPRADVVRAKPREFADLDDFTISLFDDIRGLTLSSMERVAALVEAIRYVSSNEIPGDIVECGVWKGGSMVAAARTLLSLTDTSRTLWLYDTFSGMTAPTLVDKDYQGREANVLLEHEISAQDSANIWAKAPLDVAKGALATTTYPCEKIRFVQGRVEDMIPTHVPSEIALLRLDTDWYESTYHELLHLFPRLSVGGILIIDDYGHWQGAKRAVDQYIMQQNLQLLLHRIDYTGRICVKQNGFKRSVR